jgi:hypothetical protein
LEDSRQGGDRLGDTREEPDVQEREPGQHPVIHEQAEPPADPRTNDVNEYADDRVQILQPDGEEAPVPDDEE